MSAKTLSVVMPNYNDSEHISTSLRAIYEQSFAPKEVIVIDDGSTDNSVEILKGLTREYNTLRIVQNKKNEGVTNAVNKAFHLSTGDYVYSASANDLVLPGLFEKSMKLLEKFPQAGLCCADTRGTSTWDKTILYEEPARWLTQPGYLSPKQLAEITRKTTHARSWADYLSGMRTQPYAPETCTCIIRREVLPAAQAFTPEVKWLGDWFLHQVIVFRYGCCYIPEMLANYRWSGSAAWYDGFQNKPVYRQVFIEIFKRLLSVEYEDVAPLFVTGHSLRFIRPTIRSPRAIFEAAQSVTNKNACSRLLLIDGVNSYVTDVPKEICEWMQKYLFMALLYRIKNVADKVYAKFFHEYDRIRTIVQKKQRG